MGLNTTFASSLFSVDTATMVSDAMSRTFSPIVTGANVWTIFFTLFLGAVIYDQYRYIS